MSIPRWHSVAISGRDLNRESAPRLDSGRRLSDVSLDVLERQLTVVMGPAASGKSTLLRILAGIELPDAGAVAHGAAADGGIALVARPRTAGRLARAVSRLALSQRGGASFAEPGARRFPSIEAALAAGPAIVLVDESGDGDWSGRERERIEALRRWVEGGRRAAVLVTDDPMAAAQADRVIFLADGSIVGDLERPDLADVLDAIKAQR